ncbi:hypothetical protein U9M48_001245 [Paspalum notatum var. saurae]|uniref:Protein kinase domain-containing protein n=1 Tax=Paspalum notatum var. saurae TaxID=547442 RepID=A0AAQ3PEN7_PASNO
MHPKPGSAAAAAAAHPSPVASSWKLRIKILLDAWTTRVSDFGLSLMGHLPEPSSPEPRRSQTLKSRLDRHSLSRITDYNIAGTVGYAPPEYVADGIVSKKNDVYGFGVTLLQTVSSMYRSKRRFSNSTYIPSYQQAAIVEVITKAWNAWETGQMKFLDPSLFDGPQLLEMKRYTQVGLLCVQDDRKDRPTMADVLEMLHGEEELLTPRKPSFINSVKKNWLKKGWRAGADLQPVLELQLPHMVVICQDRPPIRFPTPVRRHSRPSCPPPPAGIPPCPPDRSRHAWSSSPTPDDTPPPLQQDSASMASVSCTVYHIATGCDP